LVLVYQLNNSDGSTTYQYRSATAVDENFENKEFIRLKVMEK